jgi:AcrR family transcriptional regulator
MGGAVPGAKLPEAERREAILRGAFAVAARDTLGGLSMRSVAEAAGVSKGLVFFHFDDKETLLLALLDWMLEQGPRVELPPDLPSPDAVHPARRLLQVVAHQVSLLPERSARVEVFLDFWVMGTSVPQVQARIHAGFDRYRQDFLPYTRAVAEALPDRFDDETAAGLAAVIVSFIEGCALQLSANPEGFDVNRYMRAVEALVLAD